MSMPLSADSIATNSRTIRYEIENLVPAEFRKSREVAIRVETGQPIRRILPILNQEKTDLIVMNVHGTMALG